MAQRQDVRRIGSKQELDGPTARGRDRFREDPLHVIGSTPVPQYPAAYGQADHSGNEPPLGSDNPALESDSEQGVKTRMARDPIGAPSSSAPDVEALPSSNKQERR